jgi:hypothetical protein
VTVAFVAFSILFASALSASLPTFDQVAVRIFRVLDLELNLEPFIAKSLLAPF